MESMESKDEQTRFLKVFSEKTCLIATKPEYRGVKYHLEGDDLRVGEGRRGDKQITLPVFRFDVDLEVKPWWWVRVKNALKEDEPPAYRSVRGGGGA